MGNAAFMNKIAMEKKCDSKWPTGKAWKMYEKIMEPFKPDDDVAEMEIE